MLTVRNTTLDDLGVYKCTTKTSRRKDLSARMTLVTEDRAMNSSRQNINMDNVENDWHMIAGAIVAGILLVLLVVFISLLLIARRSTAKQRSVIT